MKVTIFRLW